QNVRVESGKEDRLFEQFAGREVGVADDDEPVSRWYVGVVSTLPRVNQQGLPLHHLTLDQTGALHAHRNVERVVKHDAASLGRNRSGRPQACDGCCNQKQFPVSAWVCHEFGRPSRLAVAGRPELAGNLFWSVIFALCASPLWCNNVPANVPCAEKSFESQVPRPPILGARASCNVTSASIT